MPRLPKLHNPGGRGKKHQPKFEKGYKKLYDLAIWRVVLRPKIMHRDRYTCQWNGCGKNYGHKPWLLVVDHIRPHRGEWLLFVDETNLWTLCKRCHDSHKKRKENKDEYFSKYKQH